jgi:hypothetical protein
MPRRTLVRASVVTFLLGTALGVPAAASAGGPDPGMDKATAKMGGGQSALYSPLSTEPLGRKAK